MDPKKETSADVSEEAGRHDDALVRPAIGEYGTAGGNTSHKRQDHAISVMDQRFVDDLEGTHPLSVAPDAALVLESDEVLVDGGWRSEAQRQPDLPDGGGVALLLDLANEVLEDLSLPICERARHVSSPLAVGCLQLHYTEHKYVYKWYVTKHMYVSVNII